MLTQDESMQIENFLQQNFSFWNKLKKLFLQETMTKSVITTNILK